MKTILKIAAGVVLGIVLLGAGCVALIGGAADEAAEDLEEEQAAEASDVADEIACRADGIGWAEATGHVTNSSSEQSSYFITVTFTAAGVQYAEGFTTVADLAPGATAEWSTTAAEEWRDGTTCAVTSVERVAS